MSIMYKFEDVIYSEISQYVLLRTLILILFPQFDIIPINHLNSCK
jgi:hypothetical protein